jgi:hypothetical protein
MAISCPFWWSKRRPIIKEEKTMKKALAALVLCVSLMPFSTAFPDDLTVTALPVPTIQGTYECWFLNSVAGWSGIMKETLGTGILYIYQSPYVDANTPNLLIVPKNDPNDPFHGFIQSSSFSFYKENKHGTPNLGREIIVGRVKGTTLMGQGVGFDSNQSWGGPWSYTFWAKRTSTTVP